MKWRVDGQAEASFSWDGAAWDGALAELASPAASVAVAAAAAAPATASAVVATTDVIAHETGGVLSYSGALAVLRDAASSKMTATEFASLRSVALSLNAPGGVSTSAYVQQIFDDVVLGNTANAAWNGGANTAVALGDLSASSTVKQFNELIKKWFVGADLPGVAPAPGENGDATAYQTSALPLFASGGPKLTDVNQGQVGDCWFLAALGETALQDPALIRNLIKTNGAGGFSVAFQVDGHTDYVTVNKQLSSYTGNVEQFDGSRMEFANSTTSLWAPLVEKAAAELSEQTGVVTGLQYASGQNQYYELSGGAGEGISLITGQSTEALAIGGLNSSSLTTLLGSMASDFAAGNDVLVGTSDRPVSGDLVADHMFAVTGIDAATGMVSLYNPWGANGVGDGMPESFTIAASALASDQANFYAAVGAKTA